MTTAAPLPAASIDPAALNSEFGIAFNLSFDMSPLGGVVARLTDGSSLVTVALQGAQVLGWRQGGSERLWLSPASRLGTGKAVRGGIPVCWPWFGPHPIDPGAPAHGIARTRNWRVTASGHTDGGTYVALALDVVAGEHAAFAHSAKAELTVTLADRLSLALETTNTGNTAFELTQALHTYFRVADIATARVDGLAGGSYIDKLDGDLRKIEQGPIVIAGEVDRVYLGDVGAISLSDATPGAHPLRIASSGSASAILWNPWLEKTQRLGDLGSPQAFRHMLCIETANAADDMRILAPGQRHLMAVVYSVE